MRKARYIASVKNTTVKAVQSHFLCISIHRMRMENTSTPLSIQKTCYLSGFSKARHMQHSRWKSCLCVRRVLHKLQKVLQKCWCMCIRCGMHTVEARAHRKSEQYKTNIQSWHVHFVYNFDQLHGQVRCFMTIWYPLLNARSFGEALQNPTSQMHVLARGPLMNIYKELRPNMPGCQKDKLFSEEWLGHLQSSWMLTGLLRVPWQVSRTTFPPSWWGILR